MTHQTIHGMTDDEIRKVMTYSLHGNGIARRLAGPDPRPLVEALRKLVDNTILESLMPDLYANARAALETWDKS